MQVGVTDSTYPDHAIQYQLNATSGAHVHDDDMATVPSTSPACSVTLNGIGQAVSEPSQPNNVRT